MTYQFPFACWHMAHDGLRRRHTDACPSEMNLYMIYKSHFAERQIIQITFLYPDSTNGTPLTSRVSEKAPSAAQRFILCLLLCLHSRAAAIRCAFVRDSLCCAVSTLLYFRAHGRCLKSKSDGAAPRSPDVVQVRVPQPSRGRVRIPRGALRHGLHTAPPVSKLQLSGACKQKLEAGTHPI